MTFVVHHTDCLVYLKSVSDNTFDSIVTDPPYGLNFMSKKWDKALPNAEIWKECLRVLKPGGHMVVFGAPRLYHRLTCQIEDAGFEVRDCLMWVFGSGFPKSLDVSKAIASGTGRPEDIRRMQMGDGYVPSGRGRSNYDHGAASVMNGLIAPPPASSWSGWGTALKPAYEPILLVRKPLMGTVASNVLKYGTGAINIDGCRVETTDNLSSGRWPANIILDEEAGTILDAQTGTLTSGKPGVRRKPHSTTAMAGLLGRTGKQEIGFGDTGGASRFFYCAKTSKSEREAGLNGAKDERQNNHPTVKPISLMKWLVKLITPPGGTVLDPFTGSGSTGCAAVKEGFDFVGCELEEEYVNIARKRIEAIK